MADDDLTVTVSIDGSEDTDDVTIPAPIVDALREGDESRADAIADVTLMAFVQRAHMIVHHAEEEVDADLQDAEERALDLFEERFGLSYAEATGHSH